MQPSSKHVPFTPEKYQEMKNKVLKLENLRKEVMVRLVTAREMGDLSENGAYKYAKFELGDIGRQLRRFKHLLSIGFPAPKNQGTSDKVDFGSTVTVEKCDQTKQKRTFFIVSEHESEPSAQKIAYSSPMGKAVMRKKVGDTITVTTPSGEVQYKVISIT